MPKKKTTNKTHQKLLNTEETASGPTENKIMQSSTKQASDLRNATGPSSLNSFVMVGSEHQLTQLQDMFAGHVDPDVVQLVLSECNYNSDQALETLMAIAAEGLSMTDQATGLEHEAPAVLDDISLPEQPEILTSEGFNHQNEPNNHGFDDRSINEVGGVPRENNRISFIDVYSNEVYCSNEDLYEEGACENREDNTGNQSETGNANFDVLSHSGDGDHVNKHFQGASNCDINTLDITQETNKQGDVATSSELEQMPEVPKTIKNIDVETLNSVSRNQSIQTAIQAFPKDVPVDQKPSNQYWVDQKKLILSKVHAQEPVLVVLRGIPGSGKTTLANQLKSNGVILSSDDFFMRRIKGKLVYDFNPLNLGDAHEWNKRRTEKHLSNGKSPIIIDNTNTEIWEMKPYLALGIRYGFSVFILEPTTPWKFKGRELAMKNTHGVPRKSIDKMLQRYENKHPNLIMQNICENLNLSNLIKNDSAKQTVPPDNKKQSKVKQENEVKKKNRTVIGELNKGSAEKCPKTRGTENTMHCNSNKSANSITSPQDYKELSLQELLTLSRQDSDCSKSGPDESSEASMDLTGWEAVTEHDKDFSWSMSSTNPQKESNGQVKLVSPSTHLKSCLKKNSDIVQANNFYDRKKKDFSSNVGNVRMKDDDTISEPGSALISGNWDIVSLSQEVSNELSVSDPNMQSSTSSKVNTSPAKSEHSPRRRRKKNKTLSNFKMPLIDSDTKAKLSCENWVLPKFPTPKVIESNALAEIPKTFSHNSTSTDIEDFVVLYKVLNHIECNLSKYSVKLCSSQKPASDIDMALTANSTNSAVLMLDKSSMTDEPPQTSYEEALNCLKAMFPTQPSTDLADILDKCHGNHMWAVNILLDSGTGFVYDSMSSDVRTELPNNRHDISSNIPDVVDVNHRDRNGCARECLASLESVSSEMMSLTENPSNYDSVPMQLDPSFAQTLLQCYGDVLPHLSKDDLSEEDLIIDLPSVLAFQIYSIWARKLERGHSPESEFAKIIAQDKKSNVKKKKSKQSDKAGFKCSNNGSQSPLKSDLVDPFFNCNREPESFKEIMELEKAIELSKEQAKKFQKHDMSVEIKRSYLLDLYPNIDEHALDDLFEANKFSLEKTINAVKLAIGEDSTAQDKATAKIIADCEKKIREITLNQDNDSEISNDLSHQELREKAQYHKKIKSNYMNQAHNAHSRGMRTVASYYSRQGQLESEKIKEINQLAAQAIVDTKNSSRHPNELDLHGLFVAEAVSTVQSFIFLKKQALQESANNTLHLHIITGKGNHSEKGVSKIRKAVITYLKSAKIAFAEIHSGLLEVILTTK